MKWTTNVDYIIGDGYTNPRVINTYTRHEGDRITINYKYGSPSPTFSGSFTFELDDSEHYYSTGDYLISVSISGQITIQVLSRAAATGFKIQTESIIAETPSFFIFGDDKSKSPVIVLYGHTYADSMSYGELSWNASELLEHGIDNIYNYTILKTDFNVGIDTNKKLSEVDSWHDKDDYRASKYPYYVTADITSDSGNEIMAYCYNQVSDQEHRFYFWVRLVLLKVR